MSDAPPLTLLVAGSRTDTLDRIARDLAAGLYEPCVHEHGAWGDFPPILVPSLRARADLQDGSRVPIRVRLEGLPPDTDVSAHVAAACAAPRMEPSAQGPLHDLMRAVSAVHADLGDPDMYGSSCPTPWSPAGVTVGVNDGRRDPPVPLDPDILSLLPPVVVAQVRDAWHEDDGTEHEATVTFRPLTVLTSTYDLPDALEALRIMTAHRAAGTGA